VSAGVVIERAASASASTSASAGAPPAHLASDTLLVAYATESGNARGVAAAAGAHAASLGLGDRIVDLADVAPADLASAGSLLLVVATAGEGEAPERAAGFLASLRADDAPRFDGVRFAVLALGDLAYPNFCGHGETLDARLAELGGTRMAELVRCDFDYEAEASGWIARTVPLFGGADAVGGDAGASAGTDIETETETDAGAAEGDRARRAVATVTVEQPGSECGARLVMRQELHGEAAECRSVQLTLELDAETAFEAGDVVLITPENDPAVVADLLAAVGLAGDAALHSELLALDVTSVTAAHVTAWAERTGDPGLGVLASDSRALTDYLGTHRLADLFRRAPAALTPDELRPLLRAQSPRSYSVASSPLVSRRRLDLLVAESSWPWPAAPGGRRTGVASSDLIGRRPLGSRFRVRIKPNEGFRMPADPSTPLVMIGPGSGVAPFRGFLQERRLGAASGPAWLFFGHRRRDSDYLYEDEWQAALNDGTLRRIDLAFSRDQEQKVYVQHRILERAAELAEWIAGGAEVYICGDRAMGAAVEEALEKALGPNRPNGPVAGATGLAELRAQNRLHKDTY
jgi:sulfite reductase (NADPH) flavoprotein alpha-component